MPNRNITRAKARNYSPTLVASRLEPDQWRLRINSGLCADSIPSRVVEHARFLDIKGPNMRECTAKQKGGGDKGYWE